MVNYYKQFEKFKESYPNAPYEVDAFVKMVMLFYGFTKRTANKWVTNFEQTGIIEINKTDDTNIWEVKYV